MRDKTRICLPPAEYYNSSELQRYCFLYELLKKLIYYIQTRHFLDLGPKALGIYHLICLPVGIGIFTFWNFFVYALFMLIARSLIYAFVGMVSTMTNNLLFPETNNNNIMLRSGQWNVIMRVYGFISLTHHYVLQAFIYFTR